MWKKWKKSPPPPGCPIYVRDKDAPSEWEIGWAIGPEGETKVLLPNDPSLSRITYDEWQPVPSPLNLGSTEWSMWKEKAPVPGNFVYVQNETSPGDWKIGLVVDQGRATKVVVLNDPDMNEREYAHWNKVPAPQDLQQQVKNLAPPDLLSWFRGFYRSINDEST